MLAAKGILVSRAGAHIAAYMKLLLPALTVLPGIIARALYEDCINTCVNGIGECTNSDWCTPDLSDGDNGDKAYALVVTKILPHGVLGLILTSIFSAAMSSLDSLFNAGASIFTIDVYKVFIKPNASEREMTMVGRGFVLVMVAVAFAWLAAIDSNTDGVYNFSQSIMTHLAPSVATIFYMGMLSTRIPANAAFVGVCTGFFVGVLRGILVVFVFDDECEKAIGEDSDVIVGSAGTEFGCMHFNHFAMVIFGLVLLVTLICTYFMNPPTKEELKGTTIWTKQGTKEFEKVEMTELQYDPNADETVSKPMSDDGAERFFAHWIHMAIIIVITVILIFAANKW